MQNFKEEFTKYFKESDFTDFSKMQEDTLIALVKFRIAIDTPIVITSSTAGAHASKSQHPLGKAVDLVFPKYTGKLFDLIKIAEKCGFTGIGIYPHWHYNGKQLGGLHLDTRLNVARWMGVAQNS
jgi:hypothetical protein